jgi:DNA-binding transcriptional LysR family regulator
VVEAGGFVAAARQIRLSSTMISKHVRELEGRLWAQLFHKTKRSIGLTEVGPQPSPHFLGANFNTLARRPWD